MPSPLSRCGGSWFGLLGSRTTASKSRLRSHSPLQLFPARTQTLTLARSMFCTGVYDFRGGPERYAGLLRAWLAEACEADLLMCHPSLPFKASDSLLPARASEFAVLAGSGFTTALGPLALARISQAKQAIRRIAHS